MPPAPQSILDRLPLRGRVPAARGPAGADGTGVDGHSPAARLGRRLRPVAAPALIGGGAGLLGYLLVRGSLIDDTYITLCYARNVAFHGEWALVPGHTANTATSPLNVLLLALATFVTRNALLGLAVVFVGCCASLTVSLHGLFADLGLRRRGGILTALLVIADPLQLSTVGMEVLLVLVLSVALLRSVLAGRAVAAGLLCAALVLTRPDAAVIALVLVLCGPAVRRRWRTVAAVAVLAAAPWFLVSWIALGALLPDSVIIKMAVDGWGGLTFGNGLPMYFRWQPTAVLCSVAFAAAGACWAVPAVLRAEPGSAWRRPVAALGLAGLAHFAALTVAAPAPYHWYYVPSVGLATIVFGLLCSRPAPGSLQAEFGFGLAAALAVSMVYDVGLGLPWRIAPISTNWASSAQYAAIGRQLRTHTRGAVVHSAGEVGTIAYYCDCDFMDEFSDRGVFMGELAQWSRGGGALRRDFVSIDYLFADRSEPAQTPGYTLEVVPWRPPRGVRYWGIGTPWTESEHVTFHYLELVRWPDN